MFDYLTFDTAGKKIVSRMNGINSNMLMDITVYRMKKGDVLDILNKDKETAILLLEGKITYQWEAQTEAAERSDVFSEPPYCLHICKDTKSVVTALEDSEIIIQSTTNDNTFSSHFYKPTDCKIELMGETQWEGTAKREVLTIFDYKNAPFSNMVMGEVITKAGRWSSYIPHSHPQPEVYYYKFDKPQGFGGAFIGENVFKVTDGSAASIPGGLTHPQTAAPGYNMYYCWMIRHLDNNPWTTRDNDPVHVWLLEE
ncbi:5-deoxy-glucuronate isomerase [Anaerocolumna sp. MB42-C2]|uniref:5-deoxy-glucuronate isomerase n=1 Tax=Anaerocolumna sp. MB42-C2 TaxID=3070997 RepID=UPI0027DF9DDC|nr:5-deoxy-glucuronate isomerase [Anaerocolumna sp. MB42-C2]WMJ90593.1 5-deoxy-glucuronate isomerase [Anaerocolumna sp. MB42-C2]